MNKKLFSILSFAVLLFTLSSSFALAGFDPNFNPNQLISDSAFTDLASFSGPAGIQQFLALKGSVLANTSPDFLQNLKEPQDSSVKSGLKDPEPNLGRLRTAAELIWDASRQSGLNPQVILVTMQKEQSLISGTFNSDSSLQWALDHAMGFNCPDTSGCSQLFSGFYFQLFGNFDAQGNRYIGAPESLMRSFNTVGGRGPMVDANNTTYASSPVRISQVGDTIYLDNTQGPPYNAPATQAVTLSDLATAALYRYTPHVFNGNYNFWKFFTAWFKYASGALLRSEPDGNLYIIQNGSKALLLDFVMYSRGLSPNNPGITNVSSSELSDYPTSQNPYPPTDNTIVKVTDPLTGIGVLYVFENGIRYSLSTFGIQQRNLNPVNAFIASAAEAGQFPSGGLLPPLDGTLVQPGGSQTVYIIQSGKKLALTPFTAEQYGYSFKNLAVLTPNEVNQIPDGGFLLPQDGTLLKFAGQPTVYILQDQILHPISGTIFNLYHYSFKNVDTLNQGELSGAAFGGFLAPPEGTYFEDSQTAAYYYYNKGTKHSISDFVAAQRNVKNYAVLLSDGETSAILDGEPLPPKDGTLIKSQSSPAIYAIVNGQKVILDYNAWTRTYHGSAPAILSDVEVQSYPGQGANGASQIQQ